MKRQNGDKIVKTGRFLKILISGLTMLSTSTLFAEGVGTSGGLTLIETSGVRSSALGEAFTAVQNDISGMGYNPASLGTMQSGQASFMYQKGLADDAFGQFLIGSPTTKGSLGLSVGYYNGGDIELFDGTTERTVNAQTDLTVALSYANNIGNLNFGATGKYLSSELIESESASAYAGDVGVSMPILNRAQFGLALQNFGTQLKFVEEGDDLPRIARAGLAIGFSPANYQTTLFLDAPYYLNEQEARPAVGLEVMVSKISIRAGYRTGNDLNEFSVGTGFMLGRSSLDYSFGLVDDLDSQHRVGLSMRFGNQVETPDFVRRQKRTKPEVVFIDREKEEQERAVNQSVAKKVRRHSLGNNVAQQAKKRNGRKVIKVRPGDSLAKLARRHYGSTKMWPRIFRANRHLLDTPRDLKIGMRIVLP